MRRATMVLTPGHIVRVCTRQSTDKRLSVAEKTVYTRGKLPAFKVGGQWRFRRADAWIDAKTRRSDGSREDR